MNEKKIVACEIREEMKKKPLEINCGNYDESKEKITREIEKLEIKREELREEVEIMRDSVLREKKEILDQAKLEEQNILSMAKNEGERIRKENKEIGYKQGYEEGYNKSIAEYNFLIQEALGVKNTLLEWKKKEIDNLEKDIIHLVLDSIQKIIQIKLEEDDHVILNILREGLNKFTFTESLIIRANSENFDVVNFSKDKILAMAEHIDQIDIKVDNSLHKGEIIIDTSSGSINPSITNQIEILKESFLKLLQSGD